MFVVFFFNTMSKLAQLALDSSLPDAWVQELKNHNRITLQASEFNKLTFKIWDVFIDIPGEFQLKIQLQGVCDEDYNLLDKPEDLSTIKKASGYFSLSGYILVCEDEISENVVSALERFASWTKENLGRKNPEGIPSLWAKASSGALVQLVVEPYTNSKGVEVFAFNGWAHEGLQWAGEGINTKPKTERKVFKLLDAVIPPAAPPVAPPAFNPPRVLTR